MKKRIAIVILSLLCAMLAFVTGADAAHVMRSKVKLRRAPVAVVRVHSVRVSAVKACECGVGCLCGPDCGCGK